MDSKIIKKIQKEQTLDIGRLLTESEIREIAYLKIGSTCFTWGELLVYAVSNILNYSLDFILEAQGQYAKEYVAQNHSSKAKGLKAAQKITQICFIVFLERELDNPAWGGKPELMKQLQKGGYFKLFE